MNRSKTILVVLFLGLYLSTVESQDKSDYTWLFSNNTTDTLDLYEGSRIDFNGGKVTSEYLAVPIEQGPTNTSICDRETGRLLFYFNGCTIVDSTHQVMLNGDGINPGPLHDSWCGEGYDYPLFNSSIILNDPSTDLGYYVIHTIRDPDHGDEYGVFYSYVDMNGNGGLGEVTEKNKPLMVDKLFLGSYLTACRRENGEDWWFILLEKETTRYLFFLIDNNGVSFHHDQFIGPQFNINTSSSGQTRFSPDGNIYAWYNPHDGLHVFDFDRDSGMISNHRSIPAPESETMEFTGDVCISPNNRYAYITSDRRMHQVDLWEADLEESLVKIADWDGFGDPLIVGFNSLLLAPDCKMYVASGAAVKHLGIIHYPDNPGLDCDFRQHDIELPWHKNVGVVPNYPHFRIDEEQPCDDTISSTSAIAIVEKSTIQVYPNPVRDDLYFSFTQALRSEGELRIYDAMGRLMQKENINRLMISKRLDVSQLLAGIYYYQILEGGELVGSGSFVRN